MARGKKRKRRTGKGRSAAATKPQPAEPGRAPELVLAEAREEPDPRRSLDMYQAVLEVCQKTVATSVFEGDAGGMWDQPDTRLYLESLFGTAGSLWRLDRRAEAARHFRELLQLDSDDHQFARYWLAVSLFGRTGVTLGLSLHNDWDDVRDMLRGLRGWDEMSGFSVIFDEVAILAPTDLYLLERNGWPVPTPEAYPVALRFEPGRQPQSPSGEDLEYVESCLQTIPDFVTGGVDAKTYEVETHGKRIKLRLSWNFSRR